MPWPSLPPSSPSPPSARLWVMVLPLTATLAPLATGTPPPRPLPPSPSSPSPPSAALWRRGWWRVAAVGPPRERGPPPARCPPRARAPPSAWLAGRRQPLIDRVTGSAKPFWEQRRAPPGRPPPPAPAPPL